jgi:hypothetical protein
MDGKVAEAAPIACTLDTVNFRERLAWITELNRNALIDLRRDDLRLELTYAPHALEDVRELMRREQGCCAFLDFDLRSEGDTVQLIVTAPETVREAAELVFGPFQSKPYDRFSVGLDKSHWVSQQKDRVMTKSTFPELPTLAKVATFISFYVLWAEFERLVINNFGIWRHLPGYEVNCFCIWDAGVILILTVWAALVWK